MTHRLVPHQSHGIGWIGDGVPSFTGEHLFNGSGFYDAGSGKRYVFLDGSWIEEHTIIRPEVWDTTTLSWVAATQTTLTTGSLTVSSTTDLTKIGGVNVGVDNALAVKPGTGAAFDIGNFPSSQTVDGSIDVGNWPSSYAVTGTFYPDTQPVSGPMTNTELRATAIDTQDKNFEIFLRQLLAGICSPVWLNMAINSLQVSQPTAANLLCTATVGTVGGLTNIGGLSADQVTYNNSAIQWSTCVRNYLT
jgi:hypothetical protein